MADRTVSLRDAEGTEYRIVIAGDRVTVNGVDLRAEQIDNATVSLQSVESSAGPERARQTLAYTVASGGVHWVFLDGEVYRLEADQKSRPPEAHRLDGGVVDGTHARDRAPHRGKARSAGASRRCADRARSDEDGAAGTSAGRRDDRAGELPRR